MSTETIFLAGVQLAHLVLGKDGPIEVEYRNDRVEKDDLPEDQKELEALCARHGLNVGVRLEVLKGSNAKADAAAAIIVLMERLGRIGRLGRLFIGVRGHPVTYGDIAELVGKLEDADYFSHYPLMGVVENRDKKHADDTDIIFEWTT